MLDVSAIVSGGSDCTVSVKLYEPLSFDGCPGILKTDFRLNSIIGTSEQPVAQAQGFVRNGHFSASLCFASPHLWDGRKDPFCYKAVCILYRNGEEVDRVEKNIGFRYFSIHPQKGFYLNGRSYPLRGVNRHQDRKNMGWAITNKEHDEDFALIYEIGANAVRLAHYPHHPHFYDLCDRYGLLVWAEIPFVDRIGGLGISGLPTDTKPDYKVQQRFLENAVQQMTELISQQCHRPSIFCWSMSNEVMREFDGAAGHMMSVLNDLVHSLDS